jgi:hypothetical protein
MKTFRSGLSIAALLMMTGCAGSHLNVRADRLEHPVSMTGQVYDDNFSIAPYEVVGEFSFNVRSIAINGGEIGGFMGLPAINTTFGRDKDISDRLNRLIAEKGGDGIVNLSIGGRQNWLFNIVPATVGGLMATVGGLLVVLDPKQRGKGAALVGLSLLTPGSVTGTVRGQVVRFRR